MQLIRVFSAVLATMLFSTLFGCADSREGQDEIRAMIAAIEKRQSDAEAAAERLKLLKIEAPSLVQVGEGFTARYEIQATATNGLDQAVKSITFAYQARSPERSVPWVEKSDGHISISGGLEPGETRQVTSGSTIGEPLLKNALDEHPDAVLTVRVTNAFGADGKSLLGAYPLQPSELRRLEQLRALLK